MVCGACGRRVDPTRSFCTNCGSSVFTDEKQWSLFRPAAASSSSVSASPSQVAAKALRTIQQSAGSFDRAAARRAFEARTAAAAPAVRLGGAIRFVIFVLLIWTAVNWLRDIPEIITLKDAFQRGGASDDDMRKAGQAVRDRLNGLVGNAPATKSAPRPATGSGASSPEPVRRAPATLDRSAGFLVQPPASIRLPPGVAVPGNGVTAPRVLHQEKARYTPEAQRARIEGSVVLQTVVRTDGAPGEIAVLRSLDTRYGLDQQAIAAVRLWRFVPGERGGRPVPVLVLVEVPFSLR